MSWRYNLKHFLKSSYLKDVYQFGVYTGQSMIDIYKVIRENNISINNFFGFDSFEGMPQETAEPLAQECWKEGEFDARKYFSVNSVEDSLKATYNILEQNGLSNPPVKLIPGFYADLKDDIIKEYNMQPALYIDIDCDIYSSAKTALDFMFRNKLVREGSILGFDDWSTPGWEIGQSGESRAFKEILQQYNAEAHLLVQFGFSHPHIHCVFRIINIKD